MKSIGLVVLGFLGSLVVVAIGDMVSEEVRARLDRLPHAVLCLAIRRLPGELRADIGKDWHAELDHILHRAKLYPVTRLIVGVSFAAGLLNSAPQIARSLGHRQEQKRIAEPRLRQQSSYESFIEVTDRIATAKITTMMWVFVVGPLSAHGLDMLWHRMYGTGGRFADAAASICGLAVIAMIVLGGFRYTIAGGSTAGIKTGKRLLLIALALLTCEVGLIALTQFLAASANLGGSSWPALFQANASVPGTDQILATHAVRLAAELPIRVTPPR